MKIEEQFFVVKNLTTGRFVFNSSRNHYTIPAYTKVLPDAQCFETIEQAEKAIERIKTFYKEQRSMKATHEFLIFQLTRTHSITAEFRP